ncbi:ABC transporter permease [Pararcticibacter amylolyticus]|uniref:ABC transporter permease n=1 Tax=Pararcticibacter amylolyticus TaxID=2173175 RepID=A0A2U2PEH4_9SPHI|nr:ABC transporter permease [Pararcticibacter amylolyticus]PWG79786.1 hypothetical protein DDR33_15355 [Pararcticibacter amylolyticus]
MLQNYFKVAWRNLVRRKFYTAVTIIGLAAGISFVLIISAYIWEEVRVNSSLKNIDRQYLLESHWKETGMGPEMTSVAPLGKVLKEQCPHLIENFYRFDGLTTTISKGNRHFREAVQPGDSTILSMFGFPLLYGDRQHALTSPDAVVITEEIAVKYFGKKNVVGQTLEIDNFSGQRKPFVITGVLRSVPQNSVSGLVKPANQVFLPPGSLQYFGRNMEDWANIYIPTYIELREGVSPDAVNRAIDRILKADAPSEVSANLKARLNPLKTYYLTANNGVGRKMIYMLGSIALFIIFMALVNFVNISIGSSASRLKEIGVRKAIGGLKKQLTFQFLFESLLLVFMAFLISLCCYVLFRPVYFDLFGKAMPRLLEYPWYVYCALLSAGIITGLLAGAYPALLLSRLNTVDSLKGKLKSIKENILFRRILITFQFVIALFVFTGAIVVSSQVKYFLSGNLGYNKDGLITIATPRDWSDAGVRHMETIRREIATLPQVSEASVSYDIPNGNSGGSGSFYSNGRDPSQAVSLKMLSTDDEYAKTYGMTMREGEYFGSGGEGVDPLSVVINESTARVMGWDKEGSVVGKVIRMIGNDQGYKVAGVVKDFHFSSMHQAIEPLIFFNIKGSISFRYLTVRVKPWNLTRAVVSLEKKWGELLPGSAFDYYFLDDKLKDLYQTEIRLEKASRVATILAVIIVLLGITGLVSLSITRRTKEVGIRKVLGASPSDVIGLFFREFSWIVVIANCIAIPLSYFVMYKWLMDYAYRINLNWPVFLLAGTGLAFLAIITIAGQTFRTAVGKPTDSLRFE